MPFHLRFGQDDLLRCRFAVSPLWETQEAVRTLKRPERHGYHPHWLRVRVGGRGARPHTAVAADAPARAHPGLPRPAAARPRRHLRRGDRGGPRGRPRGGPRGHRTGARGHPGRPRLPARARPAGRSGPRIRELADLLEAAWHALVEPDWPRLRALLEADVAFHSRRLAEVGLGGLLSELDRRLAWDAGTLTVDVKGEHVRDLGGQGLVLMPSVFSWPDVVSGYEPPWQPTLAYPARGIGGLWAEPADRTPEALAALLGRGRAAVLTALDDPATTSALAHRLGLAPSSVSAHLRRCATRACWSRAGTGTRCCTSGRRWASRWRRAASDAPTSPAEPERRRRPTVSHPCRSSPLCHDCRIVTDRHLRPRGRMPG